jgi:hypothetical protein
VTSWVTRVRAGIDVCIVARIMMLIMPVLALAAELRMEELETLRGFLYRHELVKTLTTIGASWLGAWLITTPAPTAGNDRFVAQSLRFAISFLSIGSIVETIGADRDSVLGGLAVIAIGLLIIAFDFLFFHFIEQDLATRAEQPHLVRQARLLKWINPAAEFVLAAVSPTLNFISRLGRVHVTSQLIAAHICVNIARVALSLWIIWFLFSLRRPFDVGSSESEPAPTQPNEPAEEQLATRQSDAERVRTEN